MTPDENGGQPPETDMPTAGPDDSTDIQIENVSASLWQYLKGPGLDGLLVMIGLAVLCMAGATYFYARTVDSVAGTDSNLTNSLFVVMVAVIFGIVFWISAVQSRLRSKFWQQFAAANKFGFTHKGSIDESYGSIFRYPVSIRVNDIVEGHISGYPLRIFSFISDGGRDSNYNDYETVMEIDLQGELPQLLLIGRHAGESRHRLVKIFGVENVISLEGDFNDYFTLYGPTDNEIEARQVFSPDTMALIEDQARGYSVEFAKNRLYIYTGKTISDVKDAQQLFALAKQLIGKLAGLASRLQSDSALVTTPSNLLFKRKQHVVASVFVAAAIVLQVVTFIVGTRIMGPGPDATTPAADTALTSSQLSAAHALSDTYIADLAKGDADAAHALETPQFQSDFTATDILSKYQSMGSTTGPAQLLDCQQVAGSYGNSAVQCTYRYTLTAGGAFDVTTTVAVTETGDQIAALHGSPEQIQT